jgi:CRISPR system Cascade subunit CasD
MSPDAPTLAFLLDSPLQSWGEASRFNRRASGPHPTKSGVVSLLACALGIDKHAPDEAERIAPLAALRLTTVRLPRLRLGWNGRPRTGQDGAPLVHPHAHLTDYHTIGGGYDKKTEALCVPRKASRGGAFGTVQTWREYLQDTRFAVFLQGERETLDHCAAALHDPVWGLWLGRKSCPPAVPVIGEVHDSLAAAWTWCVEKAGFPPDTPLERFDRYEETTPDQADFTLPDQPVSFGTREFHARPVRRIRENTGSPEG